MIRRCGCCGGQIYHHLQLNLREVRWRWDSFIHVDMCIWGKLKFASRPCGHLAGMTGIVGCDMRSHANRNCTQEGCVYCKVKGSKYWSWSTLVKREWNKAMIHWGSAWWDTIQTKRMLCPRCSYHRIQIAGCCGSPFWRLLIVPAR